MPITKEVIVLYTDDGMGNSIGEIVGEVVRCKDCKHYYADPWGYGNCVFEGGVSRRTKDSDFCSWGERREDADNR